MPVALKIKKGLINLLATALPAILMKYLLPRKIIFYGHLISDGYHVANERYRYPTFMEFEESIVFLREAGYRFVGCNDFFSSKEEKIVLLTFDDGFKVIATDVHPFLQKHKIPYAIFVMTAPLRQTDFIPDVFKSYSDGRDLYLSETDLLALKEDGVFIGYHTDTHFKIDKEVSPLDQNFIHEVTISSEYNHIFSSPLAFAYPFMAPDDFAEYDTVLKHLGYQLIFDTKGFIQNTGNHYYRVSMDVMLQSKHGNCLLYNLTAECLKRLFRRCIRR